MIISFILMTFMFDSREILLGEIRYKSQFTSILPCFRYSTPKFVQAITFYKQNIKLFEYFSNNCRVY